MICALPFFVAAPTAAFSEKRAPLPPIRKTEPAYKDIRMFSNAKI